MAGITQQDALSAFRMMVADTFADIKSTPNFLRSLAVVETTDTKDVSIETERGLALVANEVVRGANPNLHRFDYSKQDIYTPPVYADGFVLNDQDYYRRAFGDGTGYANQRDVVDLGNMVIKHFNEIKRTQERAVEKNIANILVNGVVTTKAGTINFDRLADSFVQSSGSDAWTDADADIPAQLLYAASFITQQGNSGSARMNVVLDDASFELLINNSKIKDRADIRRMSLADINMPQIQPNGAVFRGAIGVGGYEFMLWGYNGCYDTGVDGDNKKIVVKHIEDYTCIVMAEDILIKEYRAGVPKLPQSVYNGSGVLRTESNGWVVRENLSTDRNVHEIISEAAILPTLVSVDKVVTIKTV